MKRLIFLLLLFAPTIWAACTMENECDTVAYYEVWADSTAWDDTIKTLWYALLRNDGKDSINSAPIDSATRETQICDYLDSVNGYFSPRHIILDYDIIWIRSSPLNCDTNRQVIAYERGQYGINPGFTLNIYPQRSMTLNYATAGNPELEVSLALTAIDAAAYITAHEIGHMLALEHETLTLMSQSAQDTDTLTVIQGYKMRCFLHRCLEDILK